MKINKSLVEKLVLTYQAFKKKPRDNVPEWKNYIKVVDEVVSTYCISYSSISDVLSSLRRHDKLDIENACRMFEIFGVEIIND